jgi:hypothetical protein
MRENPVSKVLVLDDASSSLEIIKSFCDANNLIGLRVNKHNLMYVLEKNIDLGAILYSEEYGGGLEENRAIALKIRSLRPELPIILRRKSQATLSDLNPDLREIFCAAYTVDDMSTLRGIIDEYIFSFIYPNALVRGVTEILDGVFSGLFPSMGINWESSPYLVRDRIIFGEVFSLISLESNWCRGYLMLQTEEEFLEAVLSDSNGDTSIEKIGFRRLNNFLAEITNLIWGAFKSRYIGDDLVSQAHRTQVPLIVNHKNKYLSFGSEDPQLCFRCVLTNQQTHHQFTFLVRFVFNLNWSPEYFKECTTDLEGLVENGELEMF